MLLILQFLWFDSITWSITYSVSGLASLSSRSSGARQSLQDYRATNVTINTAIYTDTTI